MMSKEKYLEQLTLKEIETAKKVVSFFSDPLFLAEMELGDISDFNRIKNSAFIFSLALSMVEYDNIEYFNKKQ